ncbi:MAG: hypothetical protein HQK92_01765 [Nitrospirae bacterium]|nr:hypothetical protein [Nitrospirota bacterium]
MIGAEAEELTVNQWRKPYIENTDHSCKFTPNGYGFEVKIKKTLIETAGNIQVIGSNFIKTNQGQKYLMTFIASSDKAFQLILDIQNDNDYRKRYLNDRSFDIPANKEEIYEAEFDGNPSISALVMFKVGFAPMGTVFKVRDIKIEHIDNNRNGRTK